MEDREGYSFLKEKIKEKPFEWKRLWHKLMWTAGAGIVFGLCACVSFYWLKPWAAEQFRESPKNVNVVVPVEQEEPEPGETDANQAEEPVEKVLDIGSVRELRRAFYDIARKSARSVTEVTVQPKDEEWQSGEHSSRNTASGVIVADNGRELLVLTESRIFRDPEDRVYVKLSDDKIYEASLKRKDENLGLAVAAIVKEDLSQSAWSYIEIATLGNLNSVSKGADVIVLGRPFGASEGLAYGVVSSLKSQVHLADGAWKIIESDIIGQETSSGALFDLDGHFIGIVRQNLEGQARRQLIALPVTEIKDELERLLNGRGVPYVGVIGTDIPDSIVKTQNIPDGVYVKEVVTDSPALNTGIRSGDIIVEVDGEEITVLSNYRNKIANCAPGQKLKIHVKRAGAKEYVDITYDVVVGVKE